MNTFIAFVLLSLWLALGAFTLHMYYFVATVYGGWAFVVSFMIPPVLPIIYFFGW